MKMKSVKSIKENIMLIFMIFGFFQDYTRAQMGDLDKMMQQMLDQQREMIEEMEKGDSRFDDYVNKMFKRLRGNAFGSFSGDTFQVTRNSVKTQWQETDKARTLIVEFRSEKDKIDIKIENGMVHFSGVQINEIKNDSGEIVSSSRSQFSSSVGIPGDVDADNPQMKQVDKKIHITFKKLVGSVSGSKRGDVKKRGRPLIPRDSKKDF